MTTTFPGFRSPNYTQVPDELFDQLMSELSGAELKVLLYIIRRTFGFKKGSDNIALSQICAGITTRSGEVLDRGTGLSQSTVLLALKTLLARGIIVATRRMSRERGHEATTYSLHLAASIPEIRPRPSPNIGEALPQESGRQETGSQHTALAFRSSKAAHAHSEMSTSEILMGGTEPTWSPPIHPSSPTASQPARFGEVRSVADVLKARHLSTPSTERMPAPGQNFVHRTATAQIVAAVAEISQEFGDSRHLRANTTQAVHLWKASGCSEALLVSRLYEARSITRQQPRVVNRRSYFWAVLRDLLGVGPREQRGDVVTQQGTGQ